MRWSFPVAKIAGIEVRLHFTFLLLLAWIGFSYYRLGGAPAAVQGVVFLLALFSCVLLHEFGHAFAARAFGIATPDITLLPIGGLARLQRMPDKPWQELVVAIAGPAVNVVIVAVLFLVSGPLQLSRLTELNEPGAGILPKLAFVNIMLVVFNLVPAFPMDGGRVLRSLLAMFLPFARATRVAARIGQTLAVVFGLFAVLGPQVNLILLLIAFFIFIGAQQEVSHAEMKDVTIDLPVSEAMVTHLVRLSPASTLDEAVEALIRTSQHEFPVVDGEGQVQGVLTRNDMIAALKRHGAHAPVVEFMRRDLPVVREDEPFDAAFRAMQECGCPALPVVDNEGRFVGLITPENVGEMLLVRSIGLGQARPSWRPAPSAPN